MKKRILSLLALILIPAAFAAIDEDGFVRILPEDIVWPEGTGEGAIISVLAGDPEKQGLYIIRAKFPAGVMSGPHYHSTDRHVTVISGTWYTGTGDDFDRENMVPLTPGSYMMHPAGAVHYDGSNNDEEVIVEIRSIGPTTAVRF